MSMSTIMGIERCTFIERETAGPNCFTPFGELLR
jgi:hypothetical protein